MIFKSKHAHHRFVVVPKDYEVIHGHKKLVRGLDAQFENHYFDSHKAMKLNHWTNEQRVEVEAYLMEHPEFGQGIYIEGEEPKIGTDPGDLQPDGSVVAEIDARQALGGETCIVTFATPYGAQRCVNARQGSTFFCHAHQAYKAENELAPAAEEGAGV